VDIATNPPCPPSSLISPGQLVCSRSQSMTACYSILGNRAPRWLSLWPSPPQWPVFSCLDPGADMLSHPRTLRLNPKVEQPEIMDQNESVLTLVSACLSPFIWGPLLPNNYQSPPLFPYIPWEGHLESLSAGIPPTLRPPLRLGRRSL